jgi:hypothetical protein
MLTAEQRYWQAVQKARLIAKFELKQFLEGKIDLLPCSGDRERAFIIAEIAKAMDGTVLKTGGWLFMFGDEGV